MTEPRPEALELARRLGGASLTVLAGDASTRRFYRITPQTGPSRIVMDYGDRYEGETDDMVLTRLFLDAGLPVPEVLEAHEDLGMLVLEDLGSTLLESVLLGPEDSGPWLERAVDLAARIAADGTPVLAASSRANGPALDAARFRFEMDFFLEHYAVGLRGVRQPLAPLRSELHQLAMEAADLGERVLCHRDYHSRNLMIRPDGSLAMVDIQDARWGPDSYDLASLLRDAYVDIDEARILPLMNRFLEKLGSSDGAAFRHRFEIVGAQRMIKALGTFGFQLTVRGNTRYADAIPRTLDRLRRYLPLSEALEGVHRQLERVDLLDEGESLEDQGRGDDSAV